MGQQVVLVVVWIVATLTVRVVNGIQCHPLEVPDCQGYGYTLTSRSVDDQMLYSDMIGQIFSAANTCAQNDYKYFVCLTFFPKCKEKSDLEQRPCKKACLKIKRTCGGIFLSQFLGLNCENYMTKEETRCISYRRIRSQKRDPSAVKPASTLPRTVAPTTSTSLTNLVTPMMIEISLLTSVSDISPTNTLASTLPRSTTTERSTPTVTRSGSTRTYAKIHSAGEAITNADDKEDRKSDLVEESADITESLVASYLSTSKTLTGKTSKTKSTQAAILDTTRTLPEPDTETPKPSPVTAMVIPPVTTAESSIRSVTTTEPSMQYRTEPIIFTTAEPLDMFFPYDILGPDNLIYEPRRPIEATAPENPDSTQVMTTPTSEPMKKEKISTTKPKRAEITVVNPVTWRKITQPPTADSQSFVTGVDLPSTLPWYKRYSSEDLVARLDLPHNHHGESRSESDASQRPLPVSDNEGTTKKPWYKTNFNDLIKRVNFTAVVLRSNSSYSEPSVQSGLRNLVEAVRNMFYREPQVVQDKEIEWIDNSDTEEASPDSKEAGVVNPVYINNNKTLGIDRNRTSQAITDTLNTLRNLYT